MMIHNTPNTDIDTTMPKIELTHDEKEYVLSKISNIIAWYEAKLTTEPNPDERGWIFKGVRYDKWNDVLEACSDYVTSKFVEYIICNNKLNNKLIKVI